MKRNFRSEVGAWGDKRICLDGVEIAYADSVVPGPAIVCLHAIGHGARDFEDLNRRFATDYRVIALDFPGHGNSGLDTKPPSGTRYTELLAEFVGKLELSEMILMGNSIGGAASIRYASLNPERVKGLVLCDTGGLGAPDTVGRLFIGAFVQFFAAGRRGAFWFPGAFANYYKRVLIKEAAAVERNRIVRSAFEIAPVLEQAWRSFAKDEENLVPLLPSIRCPVLIAWSKDDFVVPLHRNRRYFSLFPNNRLEVFEGGHAPFLEDMDSFERCLRKFLEDVYETPSCRSAGKALNRAN